MTAKAKIYKPAKTAMQAGKAKTRRWKLEFERDTPMTPDPLMGWNTLQNTLPQISLFFATREEAVAYAEGKGIPYEVVDPQSAVTPPKAYAENFAFNRRTAFSHKAQES